MSHERERAPPQPSRREQALIDMIRGGKRRRRQYDDPADQKLIDGLIERKVIYANNTTGKLSVLRKDRPPKLRSPLVVGVLAVILGLLLYGAFCVVTMGIDDCWMMAHATADHLRHFIQAVTHRT